MAYFQFYECYHLVSNGMGTLKNVPMYTSGHIILSVDLVCAGDFVISSEKNHCFSGFILVTQLKNCNYL